MSNTRTYSIIYYSIIAGAILFILLSNPFLRIPYDPWDHLLRIVSLHDEGKCFYFWPGNACPERILWHELWARVFRITGINDIFLWAKIIHVFQFSLAAVMVSYFSKTALTILINKNNPPAPISSNPPSPPFSKEGMGGLSGEKEIRIKFLSLFSVFLWFIGNGTFSVAYQQAWIMWYSVAHQGLTIPLFWYCTALTLKIFYEDLTLKRIIFYIAQIALASFISARIHPSELLYYLITFTVILLINTKRILRIKNKKVLFISVPIIFLIMFIVVRYFLPEQVPLLKLISSNETLVQKLQKINELGHRIVLGLNRFPYSFSEVALISLISAAIFRIFYIFIEDKDFSLNINFFDCLLASSLLFFMIPIVPFLAGLGGYLSNDGVVYRFFYASPWFVFLPFLIYVGLTKIKIDIPFYKIIITNILIIFLIISFSKFFNVILFSKNRYNHTFYHNVESIIHSLDKKKVGVQYSKNDIEALRKIIMSYEQSISGKPNIYYIRGDLVCLVRGVFRKYVYATRVSPLPKDHFFYKRLSEKYNIIEIELPRNFLEDKRFK